MGIRALVLLWQMLLYISATIKNFVCILPRTCSDDAVFFFYSEMHVCRWKCVLFNVFCRPVLFLFLSFPPSLPSSMTIASLSFVTVLWCRCCWKRQTFHIYLNLVQFQFMSGGRNQNTKSANTTRQNREERNNQDKKKGR